MSARRIWFAPAFRLAIGVAAGAAAQVTIMTNGHNLQIPINHGLPDKQVGFTKRASQALRPVLA